MKIYIYFPFVDGPWGGGNQFLLALRDKFQEFGCYVDSIDQADVIIFNSHHYVSIFTLYLRILFLRQKGKNLSIIHRVDGPVSIVRGDGRDIPLDRSIALFNSFLANGTVYQSIWSRTLCMDYGIGLNKPSKIIGNAPDARYFYPKPRKSDTSKTRLKIIASSWSANWRKGFDIYQYLDKSLDHKRFELIFIGNSPIAFKNIKVIAPLNSKELGRMLRQADIYLTASVDDPCSNAVHEALHCGLPVVARDSGGHPEIVGGRGSLFRGKSDVLLAIERVAENINFLSTNDLPSMSTIAEEYMIFAKKIHSNSRNQNDMELTNLFVSLAKEKLTGLSKKMARRAVKYLPIKEAPFHSNEAFFRRARWEPNSLSEWDEKTAYDWLKGVIERMPLFLDSMRHHNDLRLYRFSQSGDLNVKPNLFSSLFAGQIIVHLGLTNSLDTYPLVDHILSYQRNDGSIAEPLIGWRACFGGTFGGFDPAPRNLKIFETVSSQTRFSWSILGALGSSSFPAFDPIVSQSIDKFAKKLDWACPESASETIYNFCFFLAKSNQFKDTEKAKLAQHLIEKVNANYRQDDGSWYKHGTKPSLQEKVNCARNMIFAMELANIREFNKLESLIDLCLKTSGGRNAKDKLYVIELLHWCSGKVDYRADETLKFFLAKLPCFQAHYWPWQGGFSFYPEAAKHSHGKVRMTSGMREPDLQGTAAILQGITLICDKYGWSKDFGLKRMSV